MRECEQIDKTRLHPEVSEVAEDEDVGQLFWS